MARPRTFDEDRALDAAMRAFWANGYEATSTQDLCVATGLGRSSIYNTFSSKRDLFRRSLDRYNELMTVPQVALLEDPELPPLERVRMLLARVVDGEFENRPQGRSIGCLTVNTVVELAGRDPEAAAVLERDQQVRLAALGAAIGAGQRAGEIAGRREAGELARFVNAVIAGIRVAAKGGADRAAVEAIAATAVDALTP
ncbi:helix-turn-helix domain-containing protein [Kitasatospora sp. NPDC097605]|uniref:TetR/AcrR family transcriptional regulator n=1 Tax=Kitasatospora sp. NPDC097605 TaxID=3157226 RepID=UPI003331B29C